MAIFERNVEVAAHQDVFAVNVNVFNGLFVEGHADKDTGRRVNHLKSYLCPKATGPVQLKGDLSDPAWNAAPWTDDFVDIEGDAKPKPRHRTRAKMFWTDHALYIGAELEEPQAWATLTEHDSVIFQDNDFEVFLDPDNDNQLYIELEINALNTTWDLILTKPYRAGGAPLTGWELKGLQTAVAVDGTLNDPKKGTKKWTVELELPWSGMAEVTRGVSCPPKAGDTWRINFSRVQWQVDVVSGRYVKREGLPEDNWVWSPQGVVDMHRPERWGQLHFSEAKVLPGQRERALLHEAWEAQLNYRAKHGRFARNLNDLLLPDHDLELFVTATGFEFTCNGWSLDQDQRFLKFSS
jgi:hypothetical protein